MTKEPKDLTPEEAETMKMFTEMVEAVMAQTEASVNKLSEEFANEMSQILGKSIDVMAKKHNLPEQVALLTMVHGTLVACVSWMKIATDLPTEKAAENCATACINAGKLLVSGEIEVFKVPMDQPN